VARSMNAPSASRRFKLGAPPFERRFQVAVKVRADGYPVRVRLDPIVPVEGWHEEYTETIRRIFESLWPERITLGTLRFEPGFHRARRSLLATGDALEPFLAGMGPMFQPMEFKGKNVMFALFLSTTMISTQVTLVPSYLVLKNLHWLDTYQALIVPFLANAFGVFMMRQYFMTLPQELEDAAKLDGCGRLRFLWQVLLPLSKPIIASQALFAFMGNWNSYLWPLVVTTSENMRTLQIGLRYFVGQEGGTQWGLFMAATVFVSLPVVIFYLIVQRSFVEGIATTGLKGA
ncbi:MAG: carbohydrate ABC transporter permease, partial [Chloroflexi bacterium]|nr:carbohydrate ABC transporter permease [Chloroflexota bacterium]